jgi:hypothetical protein
MHHLQLSVSMSASVWQYTTSDVAIEPTKSSGSATNDNGVRFQGLRGEAHDSSPFFMLAPPFFNT